MCMGDLQLFAKNENPNSGGKNIYSGYRDGIRHRNVCRVNNKKWETINDGRN